MAIVLKDLYGLHGQIFTEVSHLTSEFFIYNHEIHTAEHLADYLQQYSVCAHTIPVLWLLICKQQQMLYNHQVTNSC